MASELQRIVDAVADQLKCSAAVDDTCFRIQVYSPEYGPVDDTRVASILHRKLEGPAVDWILGHGIAEADRATRVPGNGDMALLPRVCAPIRCRDLHLGYLWLVDAEERLTDADLDAVTEAAEAAALVMHREQLLDDLERARERELLRDLLSPDAGVRDHAAGELVDADLFVSSRRVAALELRPVPIAGTADEGLKLTIDMALTRVRRSLLLHNALHIARHNRGVLLVAVHEGGRDREWLAEVGERLRSTFVRSLPADGGRWRPLVGIGGTVRSLTEAVTSQRQAHQTTQVAEVLHTDDVLAWDDLWIYRTLIQLPREELSTSTLPPGLVTLLGTEGAGPLLETIECFLDLAGDTKAAAERLNIHRTTLYYRLERIEKLAGLNIRNGRDRLVLHVGLKMARLAGLYPTGRTSGPARRSSESAASAVASKTGA